MQRCTGMDRPTDRLTDWKDRWMDSMDGQTNGSMEWRDTEGTKGQMMD